MLYKIYDIIKEWESKVDPKNFTFSFVDTKSNVLLSGHPHNLFVGETLFAMWVFVDGVKYKAYLFKPEIFFWKSLE